jgi:hypothetical protein
LPLTRSGDSGNASDSTRVNLSPGVQQIVLSPEIVPAPEFQSYHGSLRDPEAKIVCSGEHILPSPSAGLAITVQSAVLHSGNYFPQLEGLDRSGRYIRDGTYRFRVSITK